jgi:hypothetical protein
MILGAAVQQTGNRDEAFLLLGQEPLLKNRNQHRALRRELSRVSSCACSAVTSIQCSRQRSTPMTNPDESALRPALT